MPPAVLLPAAPPGQASYAPFYGHEEFACAGRLVFYGKSRDRLRPTTTWLTFVKLITFMRGLRRPIPFEERNSLKRAWANRDRLATRVLVAGKVGTPWVGSNCFQAATTERSRPNQSSVGTGLQARVLLAGYASRASTRVVAACDEFYAARRPMARDATDRKALCPTVVSQGEFYGSLVTAPNGHRAALVDL